MVDQSYAMLPKRNRLLRALGVGTAAVLVLGLLGQVVRDQLLATAILFYLPLAPLGLLAVFFDLAGRGRLLGKPRFGLACLGFLAVVVGSWPLLGFGLDRAAPSGGPTVRLLHWNVHWGGGSRRNDKTWDAISGEIESQSPDIVVLSEGPSDAWVRLLLKRLGPEWSSVQCEHTEGSKYWYKLVVCSRWPVVCEIEEAIPNGRWMLVQVQAPGRPMRLAVVDGMSNPFQVSRVPMMNRIVALTQTGKPSDFVQSFAGYVGDFNTGGRSAAFDSLRDDSGFRLAARSTVGWRGTWPTVCPAFDIDHIWLRKDLPILGCNLITCGASDHRGQVVEFEWAP